MRLTTSEKLSPGRFAALSFTYAESSREMVFVPMHLCICICVYNSVVDKPPRVTRPGGHYHHRPDRRADVAHVVRPEVPLRLPGRPELRWSVAAARDTRALASRE